VDGEPAVPVRLNRDIAREAGHAVVGALARRDGRPSSDRLAQRQGEVVRLAAAEEEAHGSDPRLLALEGDVDQVARCLLALGPQPAVVDDRAVGCPADGSDQVRVAVAQRAASVAAVDDAPPVVELEPNSLAADDSHRLPLAGVEPGFE